MIHVLLLAGGSGTRFWPLSRKKQPKQFLSIIDDDPMILKTIKRLDGLIDRNNNIYSVITQQYLGQIGEGEFVGATWENIAANNPHYTSSRQPGGKKRKSKKKKATTDRRFIHRNRRT